MEESFEEGRAEAMKKLLLRLGRKRFGRPLEFVQSSILAVSDLERLERMAESLPVVSSWQELLETP